ncbi:Spy/CpxP family protein refolding chaperone [Bdellovibrio bacteriovorus]|uniref:Spy/CpxP family protein refolding chaperone n=1 Tax=Bdellovibrio bacteriovorus TaxID=959 RepID=UPI0035A8D1AC
MKFSKSIVTVLAITMLSGIAFARGEGRGHHHKGDVIGPMERQLSPEKMRDLGLSEEQTAKLKALRETNKAEVQKLREETKKSRQNFKEAIRSNASKEVISQAFQSMMDKKTQLGKVRLESLLSARDILTDEQRAKLFSKER